MPANLNFNVMRILSIKKFKAEQRKGYALYCDMCAKNNVEPFHISRYFPMPDVNYGFVRVEYHGYTWAKTKRALS